MKYEVVIETTNPCGKSHDEKEYIEEVVAETPEAFVKEHCSYPIIDAGANTKGEYIVSAGDGAGKLIRYIFSEL